MADDPACGILHCHHPLDPGQPAVEFVSPSESHYELMEIVYQLERIRLMLAENFAAQQELQGQARAYLQNQARHAESYVGRLDTPDFYPFESLPQGTRVQTLPSGRKQFHLPDGKIIIVKEDRSIVVVHDGNAVNVTFNLSGVIVLPGGLEVRIVVEYLRAPHDEAGIGGLPANIHPIQIGRGRYRVTFSNGVILTVWHALSAEGNLPAQECMLQIANPTGGILVVSRKGIQGIGLDVQVRLLADGALGFKVLPDPAGGVQYLHSGVARPQQSIVQVALSSGVTITYRCGRSGNDPGDDDNTAGAPPPRTFTCEERDTCPI